MFRIKIHENIRRLIAIVYYVGFWHRQDKESVEELSLKLFYSLYGFLLPLSLIMAAYTCESVNESIFSLDLGIISFVIFVKLLYMIWHKDQIIELLDQICEYSFDDRETYVAINSKLEKFIRFVVFYMSAILFGCGAVMLGSFIETEKTIFLPIAVPLDWQNNDIAFWMAFAFSSTEITLYALAIFFNVIMWYLMANCSWRYEVLGSKMKKIGEYREKRKISNTERDKLYLRDFEESIKLYDASNECVIALDSFLSNIFKIQLTTSALCICGATYILSFAKQLNLFELYVYLAELLYSVFDIFMIAFYGNEIKSESDALSHRLYESVWIERGQAIRCNVLMFGEFLKKPIELVVLKLYPLTLETFMTILNSAYSMFNILQNFK